MGYLVLEGGAEFGGRMAEPDRRALALAGGPEAPIVIIPTAAAPDHNHERAGQTGGAGLPAWAPVRCTSPRCLTAPRPMSLAWRRCWATRG